MNDIDGPPPFDITLFEKALQHWNSFQNGEHDMESEVKKALEETVEHCIATMVATCKDAMEEAHLNEILALVDGMHSVSGASACVCFLWGRCKLLSCLHWRPSPLSENTRQVVGKLEAMGIALSHLLC